MSSHKRNLLAASALLACCQLAGAVEIEPSVNSVALGTDYLHTTAAAFDFGPGFGVVNLTGSPIGPGNTDTIVQRQQDAAINGSAISIQLLALSLQSTAPILFGGNPYNVAITLDPGNLPNDTGTAFYTGSIAGGTFTSNLNVFFQAVFLPTGAGSPFSVFGSVSLSNGGAAWLPDPPPGAVIVAGIDDDGPSDQPANLHRGLASTCSNIANFGVCEVDAFVSGNLTHIDPNNPNNFSTVVTAAGAVPEPATWTMIGLGLAAVTIVRRRKA